MEGRAEAREERLQVWVGQGPSWAASMSCAESNALRVWVWSVRAPSHAGCVYTRSLQELVGSAEEAEDAEAASNKNDGDAPSRGLRERRGLCVTSVAQLMPLVGFGGFLDQFLVKQQEASGPQGQKELPGPDEEAKGGGENSESDGYEEEASE